MAIPEINSFTKNVVKKQLLIDSDIVSHPVFKKLLARLHSNYLSFTSVAIESGKEQSSDVLVFGTSEVFSAKLDDACFCVYEDGTSQQYYEFEWQGGLRNFTLDFLVRNKFIESPVFHEVTKLLNYQFDAVNFLFTSNDQAFAFQALSSKLNIALPGAGLKLEEIEFFYEYSLDPDRRNTFKLQSKIQFGSQECKIVIELPSGNAGDVSLWKISNVQPLILNKGVADLVEFFSGQNLIKSVLGDNLNEFLPAAIVAIPEFALTALNIEFNSQSGALSLVDVSIQSCKEFKVFEGLSISDLGFNALLNFNKKAVACRLSLFGGFKFGNSAEACINIMLPLDIKGDWIITIEGSVDIESLKELEAFSFLKLADLNLPQEWLTIGSVRLHQFKLIFQPATLKLISLELAVGLNAESSLIPGIKVKNPYLEFNLKF